MTAEWVDLGHGVSISPTVDRHGEHVGYIRRHPRGDGEGRCFSAVAIDTTASRLAHGPQMAYHALVSREPLTLSPSLKCRACGNHGHITAGRWVPCP